MFFLAFLEQTNSTSEPLNTDPTTDDDTLNLTLGNITELPLDLNQMKWLKHVYRWRNLHWVPTETLNEFLCFILTFNTDLQNILYTSRCDVPPPWENSSVTSNITISFHLQAEHTLVLGDVVPGAVPYIYNTSQNYSVRAGYRLEEFENRGATCIVAEYSQTNIENFIRSEFLPNFRRQIVYVPPYFYPRLKENNLTRPYDIATTFGDPSAAGGRRAKFLNTLHEAGIPVTSFSSKTYAELEGIMDQTKILVNVHQTEKHHTFEELRVLPALMRKVVVVSELTALPEFIPYHECVIWANLSEIPRVLNETLDNYDEIFHRIHASGKFDRILQNMTNRAVTELTAALKTIRHTLYANFTNDINKPL